MPNSRTSPSSGIYSLRHWALTFKLTQQQIKKNKIRTPLGYNNSMPLLLPASFVFASDNTTSANADLRPRLSTGLGSCFFLIFSVFARRYNSSALTSRWGCGDGYPLKTRSSAETHLFGIPAVHCTGSSLRTVSEQSPLSPSGFAN